MDPVFVIKFDNHDIAVTPYRISCEWRSSIFFSSCPVEYSVN